MSERYDPGTLQGASVVVAALGAANRALAENECSPRAAVLAFLEHMDQNYVGDYYIEGSLGALASMVRALE